MWPDLAVSSRCQACWLPGTARWGVKAEAKGARGRRFLAGWAPHLTRPGNSSPSGGDTALQSHPPAPGRVFQEARTIFSPLGRQKGP